MRKRSAAHWYCIYWNHTQLTQEPSYLTESCYMAKVITNLYKLYFHEPVKLLYPHIMH